jgi:hypothetical protein
VVGALVTERQRRRFGEGHRAADRLLDGGVDRDDLFQLACSSAVL